MIQQKKQKVVLIALYDKAALGIRAVFSALKKEGVDVSVIFFKELAANNVKPPTETEIIILISLLKKLNPSIVGIGLRSSYFKIAVDLTREIKKEIETPIIWGGTHPTICPEDCIEHADIVCRGEGEYPMADLVGKLSMGESIENIENLWVRTEGRIAKNKMRPLIQNLDELSLPIYDQDNEYVIEGNTVRRGIANEGQTKYTIMATRGCPFDCAFCGNNSLKKIYPQEKFVRWRGVGSVIEELKQAKQLFKCLRAVFFADELFVSDEKWLEDFLQKYKESIGLPFEADLHPNLIKEETIAILKEAGLSSVTVGIQSGSEKTLYNVYKRYTPKKAILNMHKTLLKHKVRPSYDIILDNPLEDDDDKRETLNLLLQLDRPFILHLYSLTHFPGTDLTQLLSQKDLIKREDVEDMRAKTLTNWRMRLDGKSSADDLFWNSLISFTAHRLMPKFLISRMSGSRFLKRRPKPLVILANIFRFIRIIELGMAMLAGGELNLPTVKKHIKNIKIVT